jgi:hypothetical protein
MLFWDGIFRTPDKACNYPWGVMPTIECNLFFTRNGKNTEGNPVAVVSICPQLKHLKPGAAPLPQSLS